MQPALPGRVRFGPFELDPRAGELHKDGHATLLHDQQFHVLLILIERNGEIATREEIRQALWPNDTVVEFDHSINNTIKNLRYALGDSAKHPQYIETIASRGYRLMVPVECLDSPEAPPSSEDSDSVPASTAPEKAKLKVGRLTGKIVSHYRVLEIIGGGGMGLVYRAEDVELGRAVALKFLPEELADDPKALKRFEREAHAASALQHPNICTVYEFGHHKSQPFIAMELLKGETLRDRLACLNSAIKQLTIDELLQIAVPICDALQAAHQLGIVHRDIKPANIFLTTSGQPKILDFGLAKLTKGPEVDDLITEMPPPTASGPPSEVTDRPAGATLTRTGIAIGSEGYMSPEQIRGEKLDARTDIFSLGLVVYEMATGRRAFPGGASVVVRDAIVNAAPQPLRELNSAAPAELAIIVDKALEKDREQRWHSAAEMQAALEQLRSEMQSQAITATEPPSSRHGRRARISLLLVALAILSGMVTFIVRELWYSPYLRISETKQLTFNGDVLPFSTIESDGRRVYYVSWYSGNLYSVPVGGGEESSVATPFFRPIILHISPDGSTLLVREYTGPAGGSAARLWLVPANGGPRRPLGDIEAECAAWSPDGKAIAFAQHNTIYVTEDRGATYHRLLDTPANVSWIRWSPDGQRLRFTVSDSKSHALSIWEARRNGEGSVAMKAGGISNVCCGAWTRDGRHFLFREIHEERVDYWIAGENWSPFRSGKPFSLSAGGMAMPAATASPLEDKLFVVSSEAPGMTFKFDLARRQLTPFLPALRVQQPDFSPDGKWMIVCKVHNYQSVLWRARSDGSDWLQLTDPELFVHSARFSPDSTRIALTAKRPDQRSEIYWVSVEGGALHKVDVPITNQRDPNWMPDNQSILFGQPARYLADPDTSRAIYIHNLPANSLSKVPGSEGWFRPRLSPDGRNFLALSIDEHKLALYEFATSQRRVLLDDPQKTMDVPFWSPDGKWAYVTVTGKNTYLLRIRVNDGAAEQVVSFSGLIASPLCWGWDFAPDASLMISCYRPNANIFALRYE